MVEEVCAVLSDSSLRREMAKASREFAVSRYDLQQVCLPQQLEWIDRLAVLPPGEFTM